MLYDRVFLASLIISIWAVVKFIEEILPEKAIAHLPKPLTLYAILVLVVVMLVHTIWFALAQKRKGYFKTRFEDVSDDETPLLNNFPSIDIFVAVHNEENVIAKTVENLIGLNYSNLTIYLIDDHSSDSTKEIIEKYKTLYPNKIKTLYTANVEKKGKASALNYAFRHSSSDLIAVFDADARIESNFLLKMIPYLDSTSVAAVQSQKRISNSQVNRLTKLQENEYCMDNYFQCGKDVIRGTVELRGNGFIIKRNVLEKVGLWNEDTLTEDLELSTRLLVQGWSIRFCREAIVQEQAPIKFRQLLLQRLRWCEGSLRRYLTYIMKLFGPTKETTLSQQFDAFVFLSQFAIPLWLFFDGIYVVVKYLTEGQTYLTSMMLIAFALSFVTWLNATFGIRIYRRFSWRTSALRALETNLYFLTVGTFVVLLTFRKILFSRTKGKWHRTEHYSEVELKKI